MSYDSSTICWIIVMWLYCWAIEPENIRRESNKTSSKYKWVELLLEKRFHMVEELYQLEKIAYGIDVRVDNEIIFTAQPPNSRKEVYCSTRFVALTDFP